MSLVVDASVACNWFIEEEDSDLAEQVLSGRGSLLAPDLIVGEVANITWTKSRREEISEAQAIAAVDGIVEMFDEPTPCASLITKAFPIARSLGHPIYDRLYLALAKERSAPPITADTRLATRCLGTLWEEWVVSLRDHRPDRDD